MTSAAAPAVSDASSSYLHHHRIKQVFEQLLNQLIIDKPPNPYTYLAQQLAAMTPQPPAAAAAGSSQRKPRVVFVLGGPGAGKGTQCSNIVRDYGWVHLSAGDLLRAAQESGNETGQMIKDYIKNGQIVPVEVTVNLIKTAMSSAITKDGKYDFLVDGFPRNKDNLDGWYKVMGDFATVEFVLFFDCPEAVMEVRLLQRGQSSGRADDNPESIRKRFTVYMESTMPVIQLFAAQGKVHQISAAQTVDQVYSHVRQIFDQLKAQSQPNTSASSTTPKVVFVLGGPGSGKGTQCAHIVQDFPFVHLSAGDLLRAAQESGDEVGQMIKDYIKNGQIVPVEVTVNLIKSAMTKAMSTTGKRLFLVDGFPRNKDNLDGWYKVMGDFATVEFVLFFDCPEAVMEVRLLQRGQSSGRADDNPESIRKRFHTYVESTQPVINNFAAQSKVQQVSAARTKQEVYADVKRIFSNYKW